RAGSRQQSVMPSRSRPHYQNSLLDFSHAVGGVSVMPQTGLRQKEVIEGVVEQVMHIERTWLAPATSVKERIRLLVECVFTGLDKLGLPRPLVEDDSSLGESSGEYYGGVGKGSFRLLVNPSAPSWQARGEDPHLDLRECLDCIYHETRHHEQFLRIVERYI